MKLHVHLREYVFFLKHLVMLLYLKRLYLFGTPSHLFLWKVTLEVVYILCSHLAVKQYIPRARKYNQMEYRPLKPLYCEGELFGTQGRAICNSGRRHSLISFSPFRRCLYCASLAQTRLPDEGEKKRLWETAWGRIRVRVKFIMVSESVKGSALFRISFL